jgi:hypothetical protein
LHGLSTVINYVPIPNVIFSFSFYIVRNTTGHKRTKKQSLLLNTS